MKYFGKRGYPRLKRASDVALATVGLVVTSPLMVLLTIAIWLDDPGPPVFRQLRAGRGHAPFIIFKFRTMRCDTPELSTEELRAMGIRSFTRLGPILRKTSLDELPQLVNVLRGDMSVVGPRPALLTQAPVLSGREAASVHILRPGITGLAQVSGRDDLTDVEKVAKDAEYLEKMGPLLDLRIMAATVFGLGRLPGTY